MYDTKNSIYCVWKLFFEVANRSSGVSLIYRRTIGHWGGWSVDFTAGVSGREPCLSWRWKDNTFHSGHELVEGQEGRDGSNTWIYWYQKKIKTHLSWTNQLVKDSISGIVWNNHTLKLEPRLLLQALDCWIRLATAFIYHSNSETEQAVQSDADFTHFGIPKGHC